MNIRGTVQVAPLPVSGEKGPDTRLTPAMFIGLPGYAQAVRDGIDGQQQLQQRRF